MDARLNRVIIAAAIDNLGKGAASQAIQNYESHVGPARNRRNTVNTERRKKWGY